MIFIWLMPGIDTGRFSSSFLAACDWVWFILWRLPEIDTGRFSSSFLASCDWVWFVFWRLPDIDMVDFPPVSWLPVTECGLCCAGCLKDLARPAYWVPDDQIAHCCVCKKEFGPKRSLHHCRACGHGVCSVCSPRQRRVPLRGWDSPQRVCINCEEKCEKMGADLWLFPSFHIVFLCLFRISSVCVKGTLKTL